MIEYKPQTSRVVKEDQRKYHCKRHPDSELLVDRDADEGVQKKKSGHCDGHGGGVIDVNGADEIALFALELQAALGAFLIHPKRFAEQRPDATTRAS